MGLSILHIVEAALLGGNAMAILHERRFLRKCAPFFTINNWHHISIDSLDKPTFEPGPRNQLATFLYAIRNYMQSMYRVPVHDFISSSLNSPKRTCDISWGPYRVVRHTKVVYIVWYIRILHPFWVSDYDFFLFFSCLTFNHDEEHLHVLGFLY
jgi:hypothetical protein